MIQVADFFMPVLLGICSAFKCRYFGFFVRYETLADGKRLPLGEGGRASARSDEGPPCTGYLPEGYAVSADPATASL